MTMGNDKKFFFLVAVFLHRTIMDTVPCILTWNVMWLDANNAVAAETVSHLVKEGWAIFWRCAHLRRLLLYESTCSPSLWPFSILTAAAIFLYCLLSSHISSKMVSNFFFFAKKMKKNEAGLTSTVSVSNLFMWCVCLAGYVMKNWCNFEVPEHFFFFFILTKYVKMFELLLVCLPGTFYWVGSSLNASERTVLGFF